MSDAGYLAGIIDGEGHIGVGADGGGVMVRVRMCDGPVVAFLQEHWPAAEFGKGKHYGADRPFWYWIARNTALISALEDALPHLIAKRERAEAALELARISRDRTGRVWGGPGAGGAYTPEVADRRRQLATLIRSQNWSPMSPKLT